VPNEIRVAIGSEPEQRIAAEVLKASILYRTEYKVVFSESWTYERGWDARIRNHDHLGGTLFSFWRWLVPQVFGMKGKAIYLDSDQMVMSDINELWNSLPHGKHIAAVIGAQGHFGGKKPEPMAVETSVMVMDCELCAWNPKSLYDMVKEDRMSRWCEDRIRFFGESFVHRPKSDYAALMQAAWIPRGQIAELDPGWNYFNTHKPGLTKLLHWSCVRDQPYRNPDHETAPLFIAELQRAIKDGQIDPGIVREEVELEHIDKSYLEVLN
jgi:lipopolysaccharide biosynthesis glycosyltransferase